MRSSILSFCFVALAALPAAAQDNYMMVNYQVGFPTGHLNDYVEKTSWRGINLGFRHVIDGQVAVGMDLGTQLFFERKDYDTYESGTASISGTQYRYSWSSPITAQFEYVLNEGSDIRPFAGMGIGTMYTHRVTEFGMYKITQDPWQFLIAPELGVSSYMSNGSALILSAKYFAAFDSRDMNGQSFLALNIGVLFHTN